MICQHCQSKPNTNKIYYFNFYQFFIPGFLSLYCIVVSLLLSSLFQLWTSTQFILIFISRVCIGESLLSDWSECSWHSSKLYKMDHYNWKQGQKKSFCRSPLSNEPGPKKLMDKEQFSNITNQEVVDARTDFDNNVQLLMQ